MVQVAGTAAVLERNTSVTSFEVGELDGQGAAAVAAMLKVCAGAEGMDRAGGHLPALVAAVPLLCSFPCLLPSCNPLPPHTCMHALLIPGKHHHHHAAPTQASS